MEDRLTNGRATLRALLIGATIVALIALGSALGGCALIQPQVETANLCLQMPDRNAAITCVKAGYAAVLDAARLTNARFTAGQLDQKTAIDTEAALEKAYATLQLAEAAVTAGDLSTAQGQYAIAMTLLTAAEKVLK